MHPMDAWHDYDADNDGNDIVENKKTKRSTIQKLFARLFGGCVRKNKESYIHT